jgi:ubiquinone/menaquinone biosynthesis C-methylase UbiE
MHVNYEYVLEKAGQIAQGSKILDYGCGAGDVVMEGSRRGLDIIGVETFYGGSKAKDLTISRGLLNQSVFSLSEEYEIPFNDSYFDFVISNQVFEHVEDLQFTIDEIFRVLKPGGKLLALFPDKTVLREGHCGVPFAHWFSAESKWRYRYMRIMRLCGFGYFKNGKSHHQWVVEFIEWLNKFTYYRRLDEIQIIIEKKGFVFSRLEFDYIEYRISQNGIYLPKILKNSNIWKFLSSYFCRKLGGLVIYAVKPGA